MKFTNSEKLFAEAQKFIPGGVNSPVRAFKSVGGTPIFFEEAKGAYLTDVDGNKFIDFVGSWGPMLLGHAYPPVINAAIAAAKKSTSFGAPCALEVELASLITKMVPNCDKIRMVNSGTEACMSAIRVARGYTGKDKILKFRGNYHGHCDSFLIQAGSGAITLGHPSSPGVTKGTSKDTLLADYNDLENVQTIVDANKGEIAAIILEPVSGNMGCIAPKEGFLQGLRQICDDNEIVLIFDEVMCGFRVAEGGAQERYGVNADLVTLGKIIGAGMPVGAYGGKAEIMKVVAPDGPVYQAGTLSGNPVAMACGLALLSEIHANKTAIYNQLEATAEQLEKGLSKVFDKHNLTYTFNRVGAMMSFHFCAAPIENFDDAKRGDNDTFKQFFHGMLHKGVYLPPSAYEALFISTALTSEDIEATIKAADEVLAEMK